MTGGEQLNLLADLVALQSGIVCPQSGERNGVDDRRARVVCPFCQRVVILRQNYRYPRHYVP
jgi:hypothetical protein